MADPKRRTANSPSPRVGEGLGRGGRSTEQRASALGRAKHMRSHPTDAEQRLWQILRAKRPKGWKFRRQAQIGPYIPDFVCHRAKIIVEAMVDSMAKDAMSNGIGGWPAKVFVYSASGTTIFSPTRRAC